MPVAELALAQVAEPGRVLVVASRRENGFLGFFSQLYSGLFDNNWLKLLVLAVAEDVRPVVIVVDAFDFLHVAVVAAVTLAVLSAYIGGVVAAVAGAGVQRNRVNDVAEFLLIFIHVLVQVDRFVVLDHVCDLAHAFVEAAERHDQLLRHRIEVLLFQCRLDMVAPWAVPRLHHVSLEVVFEAPVERGALQRLGSHALRVRVRK